MLGFKSYKTSASILSGVETMHMVKKSVQNQNIFINQLFGLTA
ncbi:IS6 family transposase, partial [Bacillus mycoides]